VDARPESPPPLARRPDLRVGLATIRPALLTVEGPLGAVKAEPRVIQVLLALADAKGGVLSRDDLLRLCWDNRIVGDDAINRAIAGVRRLAEASGAGFEVETVPRVGYRLAGVEWPVPAVPNAAVRFDRRRLVIGGATALMIAGGVGALILDRQRDAEIDALIERGRLVRGAGGPNAHSKAETYFRAALKADESRADAWGWLATVLSNFEQSREAARRALALDPREPNARTVLAVQRRDLDDWAQWEGTILDVLRDAPDCALALAHLTFFYQGMGRCKASWDMNERGIAVEPFSPGHQHRRAIKHWLFGRVGEADKVIDQALQLWPGDGPVWNARILIYAFTDRAAAGLAFLDDVASRPKNLTPPSIESWRAALTAIADRSTDTLARAIDVFDTVAPLAPGLAANAVMAFSYLGDLDTSYRFAEGLLFNDGSAVQRNRGGSIDDVYAASAWGRTQFLFIPATAPFRSDPRFPGLCERLGHVAYWRQRGIWPDPFVRGAIDPATLA
jgi:tetratricopeptide (TPR) repeat protein